MAKYSLNLETNEPDEIILNSHGDKILVSADDAGLWNRFLKGCKEIIDMSEETGKKIKDAGEGLADGNAVNEEGLAQDLSEADAILDIRNGYCERAVKIIDGIFGEGTLKKSYRAEYESIPGFIPDEGKILAFLDTMTPIMEDVFGKKIERMEKESRKRMEKYIPQGHKKKGKK